MNEDVDNLTLLSDNIQKVVSNYDISHNRRERFKPPYNWVFRIKTFEDLQKKLQTIDDENYITNSARKFFDVQRARLDETIFDANKHVVKEKDKFNKNADFAIDGEDFDLKSTLMPRELTENKTIDEIRQYFFKKQKGQELFNWFYDKQDKTRRYNQNRIFLIMYSVKQEPNYEFKMASNVNEKYKLIDYFCNNKDICTRYKYNGNNQFYNNCEGYLLFLIKDENDNFVYFVEKDKD